MSLLPPTSAILNHLHRACAEVGADIHEVCGKSRDAVTVLERRKVWHWMRTNKIGATGMYPSFPEIGGATGHAHSSVHAGIERLLARKRQRAGLDPIPAVRTSGFLTPTCPNRGREGL